MTDNRSHTSIISQAISLLCVVLFVMACNTEVSQKLEPKGSALGKMNEIVVIADKNLWEGAVGDTFRYYFESAYPILPQPEPLFDVRHFTPEELLQQPLRKELRTYTILANLADFDSPTTRMVTRDIGDSKADKVLSEKKAASSVGKDKWARGQLLVYLYGASDEVLSDAIIKNFSAIAKRVNQHDHKQLKSSIYLDKVNLGITEEIKGTYGLDLDVPGDYIRVPHDKSTDVLWLRKDTDKAIMNIVIQKVPYQDQAQFSKDGMTIMRNNFGKNYITTSDPEDAMVVDTGHLPIYEYSFQMDEHYGKEFRGLWEMTHSFAGGPFNTYMVLNEATNELIYIDVFVLAPGTSKRDLMMQLDHIVKNAKILS